MLNKELAYAVGELNKRYKTWITDIKRMKLDLTADGQLVKIVSRLYLLESNSTRMMPQMVSF